jgi:undecaprenyl phosphate-alpha-L-ara4FN deformylase
VSPLKVGLRIDADTLRGTRRGVPALSRLLAARAIRATFFFSVGPDNMGRHLWRLARPAFLWKMLRSNAPALYGWEILLRGTLWPGPHIARRHADVIRMTQRDGHEIGLHAWDHHAWQAGIDSWSEEEVARDIRRGFDTLTEIAGRPPTCSAAPAWKCTEQVLRTKLQFPFAFNSDCRGSSVFMPEGGSQPQIPVTLPTYDELVGRDGLDAVDYYTRLGSLLVHRGLNVLAIHAEVEGIRCKREFERFVDDARLRGWEFVTLGSLVASVPDPPPGRLERVWIAGRQGWAANQRPAG